MNKYTNFIAIPFFTSLLILLSLCFTFSSQAKIHIEPYAGWSFVYIGSKPFKKEVLNKLSKAAGYLNEGKYYHGVAGGMRLGYSSLGLAVGADFSLGYWTSLYKENLTPSQGKETIIPYLPGLFVSYKLPLLFRAYATFIPHTRVQFSDQNNTSKYCNSSRGVKLGLSYFSLPFISINVEYLPLYISGDNCQAWSHTGTAYVNFIF